MARGKKQVDPDIMLPAQLARIHLLPAKKAPVVVVIRRKPTRLFPVYNAVGKSSFQPGLNSISSHSCQISSLPIRVGIKPAAIDTRLDDNAPTRLASGGSSQHQVRVKCRQLSSIRQMTPERQCRGTVPFRSESFAKEIRSPTCSVCADFTTTAAVSEFTI
jgi:hypothetical protein